MWYILKYDDLNEPKKFIEHNIINIGHRSPTPIKYLRYNKETNRISLLNKKNNLKRQNPKIEFKINIEKQNNDKIISNSSNITRMREPTPVEQFFPRHPCGFLYQPVPMPSHQGSGFTCLNAQTEKAIQPPLSHQETGISHNHSHREKNQESSDKRKRHQREEEDNPRQRSEFPQKAYSRPQRNPPQNNTKSFSSFGKNPFEV